MKVPGLPITWINSAFVRLTGYAKDAAEGRNCRYMQGPKTEADSLRAMVLAIRSAKTTTLHLTNYRKSGEAFVNCLTLAPILDSSGEYRYSIGVLGDGSKLAVEGEARDALLSVLPKAFPAAAQPAQFDPSLAEVKPPTPAPPRNPGSSLSSLSNFLQAGCARSASQVDTEAQREQYRKEMVKFTRLVWSLEWDPSLKQVLAQPNGLKAFGQWLQKEVRRSIHTARVDLR